ncbi:MAG: preprotein translocase subunit YajC [Phycisphaerae bacterium]|jgi:preprotein translocase subunit YajC
MFNSFVLAEADVAGSTVTMEQAAPSETSETILVNGSPAAGETQAPARFAPQQIILLVGLFVLMYFMLFHGPKKQQKKQQQMRDALAKGDKVVSIGGIYGTIVDIKDGTATLKVDESTNTKIKIKLSAVAGKAGEPESNAR